MGRQQKNIPLVNFHDCQNTEKIEEFMKKQQRICWDRGGGGKSNQF